MIPFPYLVSMGALSVSIVAPLLGMLLFYERRLSKVEQKLDGLHDMFLKMVGAD